MPIQALVEEGVLYTLPRRGTFVADINTGALQYDASRSGKGTLKNTAKQLIALILPQIDDFTGNILRSVEQSCSLHGYHLVVKLSEDLENEELILLEMSASSEVEGILYSQGAGRYAEIS